MKNKIMEKKPPSATDHLANERTFLAWIRTSIAFMAFGFVVVKFALFVKLMGLEMTENTNTLPNRGYSVILGLVLVGIGILMAWLAYYQYRRIERELLANTFFPSSKISMLFTFAIILVGLLLIIYLMPSLWA
jgi:putative membrane protein